MKAKLLFHLQDNSLNYVFNQLYSLNSEHTQVQGFKFNLLQETFC